MVVKFAMVAPKKFTCRVLNCKKTFSTRYTKLYHEFGVHTPQITCTYEGCGIKVKPRNLQTHIWYVHDKIMVKCEICKAPVRSVFLKKHIERCKFRRERKFKCGFLKCQQAFTSVGLKNIHIRAAHGSTTLCPYENCHVRVKTLELSKHVKLEHKKTKKLQKKCASCGISLLEINFPIHRDDCETRKGKLFKCNQRSCSATFLSAQSRDIHIVVLHGEK